MIIPYGFHNVHGTMNWLWSQPTLIPWIPHGIPHGFHGFQVDSIWIIPGKVKTSNSQGHYKISEKQTTNICSPKKRTLQNICSPKKQTLQTFIMKRTHSTNCCKKQWDTTNFCSLKKQTTNFANRSLTCAKAVSKHVKTNVVTLSAFVSPSVQYHAR